MALSQRVVFTSYASSGTADTNSGAMGRSHSLPSAMTRVASAGPGIVAGPTNSITINSIITLLPSGLNQKQQIYYCADTVSTINTNGS